MSHSAARALQVTAEDADGEPLAYTWTLDGQLLAAAGVLKGRRCTGYPAVRPELRAAGADWVDTPLDSVCVDAELITAPAWPAHPAWLAAFLKVLGTSIKV